MIKRTSLENLAKLGEVLLGKGLIYLSSLQRDTGLSWFYIFNRIGELEKKGLITIEKAGRIKTIELTKKGKKFFKCIIEASQLL